MTRLRPETVLTIKKHNQYSNKLATMLNVGTRDDTAVFTREMAVKFMNAEPDPRFPCRSKREFRPMIREALSTDERQLKSIPNLATIEPGHDSLYENWVKQHLTYSTWLGCGFNAIMQDVNGRCLNPCCNGCTEKVLFNHHVEMKSIQDELKTTKAILKSTMNAMEKERLLNAHKLRHMTHAMSQMRADLDCRAESPPQTSYEVKDGKQRQWLL
jgi:hypothetical protein